MGQGARHTALWPLCPCSPLAGGQPPPGASREALGPPAAPRAQSRQGQGCSALSSLRPSGRAGLGCGPGPSSGPTAAHLESFTLKTRVPRDQEWERAKQVGPSGSQS